jgi:ATP:ADP antiporter, AAA family
VSSQNKGIFAKLMKTLSAVEPNEIRATSLSFLFVFILMAAYYPLRNVRDALASNWTDPEISWLWTLNFFISTAIVAVYGFAVTRIPFKKLVPSVYAFFAASFVIFFVATSGERTVLIDKAYYVWISVFALFHLSVFWSFVADTFNKEQASRLFGIFAGAASLGAIFGPLMTGIFAEQIGGSGLMLVSAVMLMIPIPIILVLDKLKTTELGNASHHLDADKAKIGGNPFKGFVDFFANPYLLGIGCFLILYTGIGTFVYFQQVDLLRAIEDEARRAAIYGYRDAIVNTLTYILAFFVTGRMVSKLGMPSALMLVPVVLIFGMAILAFTPVLLAAVTMHVALRAGNYGLTRPSREMLFTVVDREERFKAKPVIDIVVYRGGDVMMGWFYTGLSTGLGLGLAAIAAVGAIVSALWAFVGLKLGQSFDRRDKPSEEESSGTESSAV